MPPRIPSDELIADLQQVDSKIEESLTKQIYSNSKYASYTTTTIQNRFGSWNNGLIEADINLNQVYKSQPIDVISDLRKAADDGVNISAKEYRNVGSFSSGAIRTHYDRWWKAIVSAGLSPRLRRPLSPEQFDRYYREVQTLSPDDSLPVLLFMFSGLSSETVLELSPDWERKNRDPNILKVPTEVTGGQKAWFIRLPESWENLHTGNRIPTKLPETMRWVLDRYGKIPYQRTQALYHKCCIVAEGANLSSRERVSHRDLGKVPEVRPRDLTYSYGVNLVRQNIDSSIIKRQLGAEHRDRIHVDDVMLWAYVHNGYEHPEFDPPPVILDPDTGDPRY